MSEIGYENGEWTIKVDGGPAFMSNAVSALDLVRRVYPAESTIVHQVLQRLREACEEANASAVGPEG